MAHDRLVVVFDQSFGLQPVKGGVQRSGAEANSSAGDAFDVTDDAVAVLRRVSQCDQHQARGVSGANSH
jgi:hypothetical protein